MPRLRRLTGKELIEIFEQFGFAVIRIEGSHHHMRREIDGKNQYLLVSVHGKKSLGPGLIRAIYRQALAYIPEDKLRPFFYSQ